MYTRITSFEATDINAVEAQLDDISKKIAEIPGVIRMQAAWTGEGKGMVIALYESKEAAQAGQAYALGIWNAIITHLAGMPDSVEYERGRVLV
ncbi:hypothetical protein K3556_04330 [Aliiroseovarius sp. M344]|uniref:hypothetical protein n=1 Tax=Aliiroseovarius sp. M344 TaxID=2867010 RepID=UPI0021ADA0F4|nr:hypothetical protein [Aliiroseovarius sp. M344]UWQ15128.1 hypothetical protein K3556_04330 [Aliiroseovarius sp. M344]